MEKGLDGEEELVRKLLGSPALVAKLSGVENEVATSAYVNSIRVLFSAAAGLSVIAILMQAGTGWRKGVEKKEPKGPDDEEEEEDANGHSHDV